MIVFFVLCETDKYICLFAVDRKMCWQGKLTAIPILCYLPDLASHPIHCFSHSPCSTVGECGY